MRYAVYRILYGEDFIAESIKSVLPHVDKVFVFWTDQALGGATSAVYRGEQVAFGLHPGEPFDDWRDRVEEIDTDKIVIEKHHHPNFTGQFTIHVNDLILPRFPRPDTILSLEPDHVFRADQIEAALTEFEGGNHAAAKTRQVELWRTPSYRCDPERPWRTGTVLWNLSRVKRVPPTHRQAQPIGGGPAFGTLDAYVHNFGFCVSEKSMYWKHVLALGFSPLIGDSIPNEDWYESIWLKWHPDRNNANLEISRGAEHHIQRAVPYPEQELPELIREKGWTTYPTQ